MPFPRPPCSPIVCLFSCFFFQAEDGIRDRDVTGVQTCALPIYGVERYLEGLRNERFQSHGLHELVDSLEQLLYLLLYFDVEPELIQRFAETYEDRKSVV